MDNEGGSSTAAENTVHNSTAIRLIAGYFITEPVIVGSYAPKNVQRDAFSRKSFRQFLPRCGNVSSLFEVAVPQPVVT